MSTKPRGFTLVEVLVISPVVILFIGVFISLLVSLTGESLVMREKNAAIYNSQTTLDDIETSIAQATSFLTTTGNVALPQGKEDYDPATPASTTPFTNTGVNGHDALIIQAATTNKSPNDSTRKLIYTGAGTCDSKNPLYTYMIVYFVAFDPDTADTADKALYKRTIVPPIAACDTAWQRNSCKDARLPTYPSVCKTSDEKLVSGISTFDVSYYIGSNATAEADSNAAQATDVSVNLGLAKQVAGNSITQGSNVRTNSVNVQAADSSGGSGGGGATTPPANPPITNSRDANGAYPYRTTFSWGRVGNASSYLFRYNFNGGAWVEQTVAQPADVNTQPSFNVEGTARKQAVNVQVDVVSNVGTYSYGTGSATATPSWNECVPQNGWQNYDGTYNTLGFTKTTSGAIGLKGLIRSGSMGGIVCTLPAGFRPPNHLIFNGVSADSAGTYGNGSARIDVHTDGRIQITSGSNPAQNPGFVSLDGIIYMSNQTVDISGNTIATPWQAGTWLNGWYYNSYSDTYPNLGYWKDFRGRVWVQGLASGGPASVIMANLPANMYPSAGMHYNVSGGNVGMAVNVGASINSRPAYGSYMSTQLLYYAATGGMANLNLYNGWVSYDNGVSWTHPTCYQGTDDIVVLQGLVRAGNQAAGGMTHVGVCGATPYMSTGRRALFTAWKNWESQGRMDLPTDGYLYPMQSDPGWTSLDGIHYIAN